MARVTANRSLPMSSALTALIALSYVAFLAPIFRLTMGDGFIVARYAERWVDHGELAFNAGERIWSFTSPLHVALEAVGYALTGETIRANKIMSVVCVLAAVAVFCRAICRSREESLWACAVLLLSPCLVFWTVNGLETAYLFLLVTLLLATTLSGAPFSAALFAALAVLCRYDTVLFAAPAMLFVVARSDRSLRALAAIALPWLLVLAWVAFARAYYGDWVPTSFHHKHPSLDVGEVLTNAVYELQFVLVSGVLIGLFAARPSSPDRSAEPCFAWREHGWLVAGVVAFAAYALTAATKHMMFGYRLLLPYLPALLALVLLTRRRWDRSRSAGSPRGVRVGLAIVALQWACWAHVYFVGANPSLVGEFRNVSAQSMLWIGDGVIDPIARALDAHWRAQERSAAPRIFTGEAGQIPYRLPYLHVLDPGLISWRAICQPRPGELQAASHYIFAFPGQRVPATPGRSLIVESQGFRLYYQPDPLPNPLPARIGDPCEAT